MEIIPGEGLPVARVGWSRAEVEAGVGPPSSDEHGLAVWGHHSPPFGVAFDPSGVVQLVEVYHGESEDDQPTFGGVRLTGRLMVDVLTDLSAAGVVGRRRDLVADFDQGFMLWSLLTLTVDDIGLVGSSVRASEDPVVCEGVAIAPSNDWATL